METPDPACPPQVMLLSLWCDPGRRWHARLVDGQARVHEFDSPFELARFLGTPRPATGQPGVGLR
jgi:hypothetical protein